MNEKIVRTAMNLLKGELSGEEIAMVERTLGAIRRARVQPAGTNEQFLDIGRSLAVQAADEHRREVVENAGGQCVGRGLPVPGAFVHGRYRGF